MNRPKRVALIIADWPVYEKYCPNFNGMKDGLDALGIEYQVFSCRPKFNPAPVIAYQPDLVLYALLDLVRDWKSRMQIRASLPAAKIVMWYGDYRNQSTTQLKADMSEIDCMFVSNNAQNEYYERIWKVPKCRFLPLGSSIPVVAPKREYAFDFIFVGGEITGGDFLDRARTIMSYRERGLKVFNADARTQPALRAKIMKAMCDIYATAKVSLDISHFTKVDGYTSNRFWIIGAAGGVALTKRFPGCEEFYPADSRVYFDTFEESLELAKKLINDAEWRERIRKRAREEAKRHTYDKRFLTMFKEIYG